MPAEIKCLLFPRETASTCDDSVGYPTSREGVYHSRPMHQCYPGEQCTREGQKTPPGNSGRPHVPRGRTAVPSGERLHLFHRAVSNHDTAVHCSVGSFRGNCSPREPSLKSTHEQVAAKVLNQIAHEFGLKSVEEEAIRRVWRSNDRIAIEFPQRVKSVNRPGGGVGFELGPWIMALFAG
jgi:hypothetical protein